MAMLLGLSCLTAVKVWAADESAKTESADTKDVKLQAGTWKDVEAIVAKHPGKIVIVDVWSMSCLPCISEFPRLVELHNKDPKNLVCVSFNVDYAGIKSKPVESYRERVEKFLKKQQATFANILCTVESEAVFAELKLASIPAVYVYGRDGKLLKRFDSSLYTDGEEEAFTYEMDINPFIRTLTGP